MPTVKVGERQTTAVVSQVGMSPERVNAKGKKQNRTLDSSLYDNGTAPTRDFVALLKSYCTARQKKGIK